MKSCFFILVSFLQHYQFDVYSKDSSFGWFLTTEKDTALRTWVKTKDGGTHLVIGGEKLKKKYGEPHAVCLEGDKTYGVWSLEKGKGEFK